MMATFLFKFSACLAVFWLVYVLLLERQTVHRFKRFYLIGSLVLSLLIPQFTITRYVEPVINTIETPLMELPSTMTVVEVPTEATPLFTTENILWSIYGIGVLLFSLRFLLNLYNMYRRISNHEHIIKKPFIYVLLDQCRIPHSFFKYLFFDKTSFETETIPKEVLLHEETHAKQLHSLDILILELLQIIFWFHPLIYLLKHHIKLNHEFLADEAVLNQGAEAKHYQNLLLQFSSNAHEYQLSSTINYSSFKKRFTVMKTQTSKTRIWLSTLLLLPIIAILFYSFAEKEYVEKATLKTDKISNQTIDSKQQNPPTQKEIEAYNAWAKKIHAESKVLSNDATWFPPINEEDFINFTEIYKRMSPSQKNQSIEFPFPGLDVKDSGHNDSLIPTIKQELATKKQVADYNAWAKKINDAIKKAEANNKNEYPIIKQKDVEKYKYIYSIMTAEQKKISETFPQGPPPPPPPPAPDALKAPKAGKHKPITVIGYGDSISKRPSHKNDIEEKVVLGYPIPQSPPTPENPTSNEKNSKKLERNNNNPSFLEYIIEMENKGATFFMDGKEITPIEAKALAKNNKGKSTEMTTHKDTNGQYVVKLSTPQASNVYEYTTDDGETLIIEKVPEEMSYAIINGKTVTGVGIKLSLEEFRQLFISHNKHEVVSFSIMFPDNKSFKILGNKLNAKALTKMKGLEQNQIITIFDIKNTANVDIPPVLITIK